MKNINNNWSISGKEAGFSLIELVLSMFILSIVLGSLFVVFSTQNQVYKNQDIVTDLQQQIRVTMDYLNAELSNSGSGIFGYRCGCDKNKKNCKWMGGIPLVLTGITDNVCQGANTVSSGVFLKLDDDNDRSELITVSADMDSRLMISSYSTGEDGIAFVFYFCSSNDGQKDLSDIFQIGDYILASNFNNSSIFRVTNVSSESSGRCNSTMLSGKETKIECAVTDPSNALDLQRINSPTESGDDLFLEMEPGQSFIAPLEFSKYTLDYTDPNNKKLFKTILPGNPVTYPILDGMIEEFRIQVGFAAEKDPSHAVSDILPSVKTPSFNMCNTGGADYLDSFRARFVWVNLLGSVRTAPNCDNENISKCNKEQTAVSLSKVSSDGMDKGYMGDYKLSDLDEPKMFRMASMKVDLKNSYGGAGNDDLLLNVIGSGCD